MENIEGYVENIVFRNGENGYTVMTAVCMEMKITCVGTLNFVEEGQLLSMEGQYINHPMYGKQFQIENYQMKEPKDTIAIERYLASGAVKGIGAALAARIVRRFQEDTFRIIEEEPERLKEIKGISQRMARDIAQQMEEKKDLRQAMLFLQQYGISTTLSVRIYEKYGTEIYRILKENPYKLADDINGIGFKIADEIAAKVGINTDSDFRIKSGLFYVLTQAGNDGHTYLPKQELIEKTRELLDIQEVDIDKHIMDMAVERKLILKEEMSGIHVFTNLNYHTELNTARMLTELNIRCSEEDTVIAKRIARMEEELGETLDEKQRLAVEEAVNNGLLIITGGPGTGKTTTINAILKYFEEEDMVVELAAPTGRAAKRMSEATGYEAKTIHRLLELSGIPDQGGRTEFQRNEENPLEADVVIVDEMSMVDIYLMHSLLKALVSGTRLVLVGDANQLPSVGPGSVLKDMIESGAFMVVRLTKIFRQAALSSIVMNAHRINEGKPLDLKNKKRDFFIMRRYDADTSLDMIKKLMMEILPPNIQVEPYDIQVMTPMRKGQLGVEELNVYLQQILNPPQDSKAEKKLSNVIFRVGDKVMQIKNDYQLEWEIQNKYHIAVEKGTGVFNGDMGIIAEINSFAETVTVLFDDRRQVEYSFKQLEELEHAYAITIHKSQGSEYPAVIMPLVSGPRMLMNRNLLYTGVTRAKKCVTIVGSDKTVQDMIENKSENKRYTDLKVRILEFHTIIE
ncbi:MAG: ATP-dependent RecD-like DNA helicase [Lachnospiraceae bacterium]|nr:ATP-dependent RecD-like DNA helicase [Lachnospiraceae bacterium]